MASLLDRSTRAPAGLLRAHPRAAFVATLVALVVSITMFATLSSDPPNTHRTPGESIESMVIELGPVRLAL